MTKLQPYSQYKDSGIDWLGMVPEGWTVVKTGHVTRLTTGWTPPTGNSEAYEGGNLWANISDLGPKILRDTAKRISDEAVAAARIARSRKGSLLFSFKLSVGQVSFAGTDMYTNEAIATFEDTARLSTRFAYYALPIYLLQNANENIYGAKLLNQDLMKEARLCLPDKSVQERIADYLDSETAQIDELIGKQERLIELLAEKRQAVITYAVTKGLDPTAPTKPSGIPWQGHIPKHWTVQPLKNLIRMQTGVTLGKDFSEVETETYPYLRVANVQIGYVDLNEVKEIALPKEVAATSMLQAGDVLMTEGGDRDKLARGCIWEAPITPCVHQNHIFAVRTGNQLLNEFLVLALDADPARSYFYLTGKQSTNLASTNSTTVKNFRFGVPPVLEQQRIVEHLRLKTRLIDDLVDKAKSVISTLKERRSALISAAVTGKIDVREGAAQS